MLKESIITLAVSALNPVNMTIGDDYVTVFKKTDSYILSHTSSTRDITVIDRDRVMVAESANLQHVGSPSITSVISIVKYDCQNSTMQLGGMFMVLPNGESIMIDDFDRHIHELSTDISRITHIIVCTRSEQKRSEFK